MDIYYYFDIIIYFFTIVTDCKYLYDNSCNRDGVYDINPDDNETFAAYCDMVNGGWTVFQRRVDATVDFERGWDEYVTGFGNLSGSFWSGLNKIHAMTGNGLYDTELHVFVETFDGEMREAMYNTFTVRDESSDYQMTVSGHSGSLGDGLSNHNNMKFSTFDHDRDAHTSFNCADYHKGGWWYKSCFSVTPNSYYGETVAWSFLSWYPWDPSSPGNTFKIKTIQFKIKRI